MDIGKEWFWTQHQDIGKQVKCDPFKRNATRWIALETVVDSSGDHERTGELPEEA